MCLLLTFILFSDDIVAWLKFLFDCCLFLLQLDHVALINPRLNIFDSVVMFFHRMDLKVISYGVKIFWLWMTRKRIIVITLSFRSMPLRRYQPITQSKLKKTLKGIHSFLFCYAGLFWLFFYSAYSATNQLLGFFSWLLASRVVFSDKTEKPSTAE